MGFVTKIGSLTTGDLLSGVKILICLIFLVFLFRSDILFGKVNKNGDLWYIPKKI